MDFIFISVLNQWSAFNNDQSKDVLHVSVKSGKTSDFKERFSISFESNVRVAMKWANIMVDWGI